MKKLKLFLLILLIALVALAVGTVVYIGIFLINQYNTAYHPVDFVERVESYVIPEYPEVAFGTENDSEAMTEREEESVTLDEKMPDCDTEKNETEDIESVTVSPDTEKNEPPDSKLSETESKTNTVAPVTSVPTKNVNIYGGVPIEKAIQKNKNIINVLLIGPDQRFFTGKRGRSDTMMVVSYNKTTGKVNIVSFLRDSLVPVEGYGWNRLNTAYAFGGIGLAVNTINNLFDLDIQYFAVIDIVAVEDFINYIGGLDLYINEKEAKYYNENFDKDFTAGICHLSGWMTRIHMQNRAVDSDFGRTRRQRDVIEALMNKILNEKSLSEILDIVEYGSGLIKTNIDIVTMASLATSVVGNKSALSIENQTVPFSDSYRSAWYNKMAVLSFDIEDAAKRINDFLY